MDGMLGSTGQDKTESKVEVYFDDIIRSVRGERTTRLNNQ